MYIDIYLNFPSIEILPDIVRREKEIFNISGHENILIVDFVWGVNVVVTIVVPAQSALHSTSLMEPTTSGNAHQDQLGHYFWCN